MHRQFDALLLASKSNSQARKLCEEAFVKLKGDVGVVVGSVFVSETENDQQSSGGSKIIGNPKGSRKKGERNVRRKSTMEKISNIVRSRKSRFSSRNQVDVCPQQVVAGGSSNVAVASNPAVDFNEMYRAFSLIFDERLGQANVDTSHNNQMTGVLEDASIQGLPGNQV